MSSQAQIDANRRNAQKSTGPKTEEGKQASSSKNALQHGFRAEDATLIDDPETREEIQTRIAQYFDYHKPEDPLERDALMDVAISRVRLDRVLRAESGLLNNARRETYCDVTATAEDGTTIHYYDPKRYLPDHQRSVANQLLGEAWQSISQDMERLSRYETRLHRRHQTALKNFQALKQARLNSQQAPPPPPPAPEPEPATPQPSESVSIRVNPWPKNADTPNEPNSTQPTPAPSTPEHPTDAPNLTSKPA